MDGWRPQEGFFQPEQPAVDFAATGFRCPPPPHSSHPSQRVESEARSSIAARRVQKADREKMRRDRLNEQFQELGNSLDPERPRNDKGTILADTIQMLKELTAQVDRLKAEYASLSEESQELTKEKNELRNEKATLKSEIDSLNAQYQQRLGAFYPWAAVNPSVIISPPTAYPFPVPVPIHSGPVPVPIHSGPVPVQSLQAFPFFRNQTSGAIPNAGSAYMPYCHPCHPQADRTSAQHNPLARHQSSDRSHSASRQDSRSKSSTSQQASFYERSDDYSDVATELELKTPGSAAPSHSNTAHDKDSSFDSGKRKQFSSQRKGGGSTSSRCSSSGVHQSASNSVGDGSVAENHE